MIEALDPSDAIVYIILPIVLYIAKTAVEIKSETRRNNRLLEGDPDGNGLHDEGVIHIVKRHEDALRREGILRHDKDD